ncbi:hypothetical protein Verru16b_02059 [Lacunisphaera limnophila]|uniref:O-antigen ligase-related domain-containing protein n=1 Tax=Lacunisphaera limnophila TaxID=1838286 RepID=A0A1D8AVR6_9BACT|nr:O-antigen ligase family protein [Lacunisphaera limnophila]AOS44990.1 hypothetical protein Verru16b_02059 [Lacunisphaera limnophila]
MYRYLAALSGILLALPFSFPAPPAYLLALLVFLCAVALQPDTRIHAPVIAVVFGLIATALLSNVEAVLAGRADPVRALYTSGYFILFLYGYYARRVQVLLRYYAYAVTLISLAIVGAFVASEAYRYGTLLFVVPTMRLWGAEFFPDWPNFFALELLLGVYLNWFWRRQVGSTAVCVVGAVLTTSRFVWLALAIMALIELLRRRAVVFYFLPFVIAAYGVAVAAPHYLPAAVQERLQVVSDRTEIASSVFRLFAQAPLLGNGSVLLDASVGHMGFESFHNSYFDVLVRHGLVGLFFLVLLLCPWRVRWRHLRHGACLPVLGLFVIGACFQNFLKHPHLFMLLALIISRPDATLPRRVARKKPKPRPEGEPLPAGYPDLATSGRGHG